MFKIGSSLLGIVVVIIIFVFLQDNRDRIEAFTYSTVEAKVGNETVTLRIADTEKLRMKGLSGTMYDNSSQYGSLDERKPVLGSKEGMLFLFDSSGIYSLWMKDMLFPIDMLWLQSIASSSDVKIVHFVEHVDPDTYPALFSNPPDTKANMVIEVPAGFIRSNNISMSTVVIIQNDRIYGRQ